MRSETNIPLSGQEIELKEANQTFASQFGQELTNRLILEENFDVCAVWRGNEMASVVLFKLPQRYLCFCGNYVCCYSHSQHQRKGTMKILMSIIRLGMTNFHHLNHHHILQLLNKLSTIRIALPR
jgi:hypothetical protein